MSNGGTEPPRAEQLGITKLHTYVPPHVAVADPGDGTKVLALTWPDEQILILLPDNVAKSIAPYLSGLAVAGAGLIDDVGRLKL